MTDPTKKIYTSIQEGLLDVARLGIKNYEKMKMTETELLKNLQELEELNKTKTPAEKAYKVHYGSYPITDGTGNEYDELAWNAFRKGFDAGRFADEP